MARIVMLQEAFRRGAHAGVLTRSTSEPTGLAAETKSPEPRAMEWQAQTALVDWVDSRTGVVQSQQFVDMRVPVTDDALTKDGSDASVSEPDLFASDPEDEAQDVIVLAGPDSTMLGRRPNSSTNKKKKKDKRRKEVTPPATVDCHPSYKTAQLALDQFNLCAQSAVVVAATASSSSSSSASPSPPPAAQELKELPLDLFVEWVYRTVTMACSTMAAQQRKASKRTNGAAAAAGSASAAETAHPAQWAASLERWSYSHMERLFVAAGPRRSTLDPKLTIHSPACPMGVRCKALVPFGITLMASMNTEDLKAHETSGYIPATPLPCILCSLFIISSLQTFSECSDFAFPTGVMAQWFYNPVDEPDGYVSSMCHQPGTPNSVLVAPVLRYNHALLVKYQDAQGVWRLNHEALRQKN